jgi:hypothetical protein
MFPNHHGNFDNLDRMVLLAGMSAVANAAHQSQQTIDLLKQQQNNDQAIYTARQRLLQLRERLTQIEAAFCQWPQRMYIALAELNKNYNFDKTSDVKHFTDWQDINCATELRSKYLSLYNSCLEKMQPSEINEVKICSNFLNNLEMIIRAFEALSLEKAHTEAGERAISLVPEYQRICDHNRNGKIAVSAIVFILIVAAIILLPSSYSIFAGIGIAFVTILIYLAFVRKIHHEYIDARDEYDRTGRAKFFLDTCGTLRLMMERMGEFNTSEELRSLCTGPLDLISRVMGQSYAQTVDDYLRNTRSCGYCNSLIAKNFGSCPVCQHDPNILVLNR